jgi:flavodoxin
MKSIVTYFSAEWGKTKSIAGSLAKKTGADLFEIVPKDSYSEADLRYMNPLARCNREKIGRKDVPVADKVHDWDSYDTVYLGFPIWYSGAPNVVNTFCKDYDWSGKKVYIFATSGGSGIGKTKEKLQAYLNRAEIIDSKIVANISELESRV